MRLDHCKYASCHKSMRQIAPSKSKVPVNVLNFHVNQSDAYVFQFSKPSNPHITLDPQLRTFDPPQKGKLLQN